MISVAPRPGSQVVCSGNGGALSRRRLAAIGAAAALGAAVAIPSASNAVAGATNVATPSSTATPIKHLVVIFQENVSFDHYFGTYPTAANTSGQPFHAKGQTPEVNGLANTPGVGGTGTLLTNNPNKNAMGNQVNPTRL